MYPARSPLKTNCEVTATPTEDNTSGKQSSPARASSIARRQVLAATSTHQAPPASATKSFRQYIQNKTPSSLQSKGYRQYIAASSNVRTNRQHRNPVSKRALATVSGIFNHGGASGGQGSKLTGPAVVAPPALHAGVVAKYELGALSHAVSETPTKSILKTESKYKYPRGSKKVAIASILVGTKPHLRWWDNEAKRQSAGGVHRERRGEAGGGTPSNGLKVFEAACPFGGGKVEALVSSPSHYSPLDQGALPYADIEPLALQLDMSEDEGASSSSIGGVDMALESGCAFVPWIVEASSPKSKSSGSTSVKRPSVLDILEERNSRAGRTSKALEGVRGAPTKRSGVVAGLSRNVSCSAGERIVAKACPEPVRKKRRHAVPSDEKVSDVPTRMEPTRESRKNHGHAVLDFNKPWGDVWHALKHLGWKWVRGDLVHDYFYLMPDVPSKKWGELGVNMFESPESVVAFLKQEDQEGGGGGSSSRAGCDESITADAKRLLPGLVKAVTALHGGAPRAQRRHTRQHNLFFVAVWDALRKKIQEEHSVDVNAIGGVEALKRFATNACFQNDSGDRTVSLATKKSANSNAKASRKTGMARPAGRSRPKPKAKKQGRPGSSSKTATRFTRVSRRPVRKRKSALAAWEFLGTRPNRGNTTPFLKQLKESKK